ncbi:AAA family ATPase [Microbulbifer sp. MLAF003]|uniref:AAA family ATPase n=1 Tax=Microbulbifer sp. MLAF003 TaxID=3032582 RepID=UPI0024AD2EB5|nr:AAA family ATPase [Microbulbifer sp. MLAF003]WHI49576.1 AAA family ATPase [Microbulbifer sp. MLAF003]
MHMGPEEALKYTLKLHGVIANAKSNYGWLDNNTEIFSKAGVEPLHMMGEGRKLRVFAAYHPDTIIPISSSKHLGHFLEALGHPKKDIPAENQPFARMRQLIQYYQLAKENLNPDLTPFGFMKALFDDRLGIKPSKEKVSSTKDNAHTEEVVESVRHIPLNQILYGPPGTGKTFNTIDLAVKITEPEWYQTQSDEQDGSPSYDSLKQKYDKLVTEKRIVFTTFHQSFAYEDFIEGIRAESSDNGQLNYSVHDGVFKELCESADAKVTRQSGEQIDLNGRRFWKMSLGNTLEDNDDIYQECLENNYVLLGYGESIDFSRCTSRDSVRKQFETANSLEIQQSDYPITAVHNFRNTLRVGDLVVISDGNRKFRAIAEITGDYQRLETDERTGYQQARPVKWHRQYEPSLPREQLFKKALSQKTLYELHPSTIDIDKLAELLAPQDISEPQQKPLVLIIDEINRGNISRIFGELITLLEPAKRKGAEDAREVILPYSKKTFAVPPNVYVIGTMNTADKSLAQLDLALRRRFSFVEMPPNPELLAGTQVYGIDIGELLTTLNQRIEALLDRDHLIGHSYFLPLCGLPLEERESKLASIFQQQILPLLQEYFFDDWQRIGWVLNDPAKHPHHRFIIEGGQQPLNELFPADIASQINERRFSLNTEAFIQADAYRGILPPTTATASPKSPALEEAESEVAV